MTPERADIAHTNELIHTFGQNQQRDMRAIARSSMKASLFDLPRRSLLGWRALYEHEVGFLRELVEHISPEELGQRMRIPGSRPYALQNFIIMCGYFGARQAEMLERGLSEGDPFPDERVEDVVFLTDFWERVSRTYRTDGKLLPAEAGSTLTILDQATVEDVNERIEPAPEERHTTIRRMAATLELFAFILHGEQRDGIFVHGPYPLEDGSVLFFKEYNDLRNDYLPWARTEARNIYDNVVIAYRATDVTVTCDMFGTGSIEPHELGDRLHGIALITNREGKLETIPDDQVQAIQQAAADAADELYLKAAGWDERYKIEYGAPLFANHLKTYFDLAGVDTNVVTRIMDACQQTADRMVDSLVDSDEVPPIWGHMAKEDVEFYWPVST